MQRSEERVLTSHVGSLLRSRKLAKLLIEKEQSLGYDTAAFKQAVDDDMDHVVAKQLENGVDVANDGELPRIGFSTYVQSRMSGFGGESQRNDIIDFINLPRIPRHLPAPLSHDLARQR